jgi:TIR domain
MNFEQNLFISFTHLDNQPLTDGEKGWITRFHATLKNILSTRIGREAKIWRDARLAGCDVYSEEIIAQLKQSAVLVSIVSSRYLKSEWCKREVREFCEVARRTTGLIVGQKLRLLKVIKTPVDPSEELPPPLSDVLGYEFFDYKDGVPLEFDPAYGPEFAPLFNQKVAKLAWEIAQLLRILDAEGGSGVDKNAGGERPQPGKPIVYLAECSYDRKQARELLDGELKRLGYAVLPDRQLPADEAEYIAAVESMLARCALSIHLVGERYGAVPDGPTAKSTGILQNELAVARCKSRGLKRLIWLPKETRSEQAPQQAFIEALHQDEETQFGADLIAGDIEELRSAMYATLKKIEQPDPLSPDRNASLAEIAAGDNRKLIYLICDQKDRKASVPLRKLYKQLGFEVELPAFEGDAAQVRTTNQQLLASCDVVVLFYGAGDEAWKRAIDNELKKMAGYRAGKSPPVIYTYLAEPRTSDKEDLIDMEESGLIDGLAGLAEAAIAKCMRAAAAGAAA